MPELTDYGFEEVGSWRWGEADADGIQDIDFELHSYNTEKVIYAFVCEGRAMYIGHAAGGGGLTQRLRQYKNPDREGKQRTNDAIKAKIQESLRSGLTIKIFAMLPPRARYAETDIDIDLVRGLEYPLIQKFQTKVNGWNKG